MLDDRYSSEAIYDGSRNPTWRLQSAAEFLHQKSLAARRIWKDIDPTVAENVCVILSRACWEGREVDISTFAEMLGKPRSSTLRLLKAWQQEGYCDLRRVGRRTIIVGRPKMASKCREYLDTVADLLRFHEKDEA
ncbi:MAG: hypothetical protein ACPGO3_08625 [Magnetospiraceae bacterium]